MSQAKNHKHRDDHKSGGEPQDPYWKRAHHDWKFWLAIVLMLTAMMVYIGTLDLSVRPDVPNPEKIDQQVP